MPGNVNIKNSFNDYFEKNKEQVWRDAILMSRSENFYSIWDQKIPILNKKIEVLKNDDYFDSGFINYLINNLEYNPIVKSYKHSATWYLKEGGIDSLFRAAPELIDKAWADFRLTLVWINKIFSDFNL